MKKIFSIIILLPIFYCFACQNNKKNIENKEVSEAIKVSKNEYQNQSILFDCSDTILRIGHDSKDFALDSLISIYNKNKENRGGYEIIEYIYCKNRSVFENVRKIKFELTNNALLIKDSINKALHVIKAVKYDSINNLAFLTISHMNVDDSLIRKSAGFFLFDISNDKMFYFGFGKTRLFDLNNLLVISYLDKSLIRVIAQVHLSRRMIFYISRPKYLLNNFEFELCEKIRSSMSIDRKTNLSDILQLFQTYHNSADTLYPMFDNGRDFPLWYWEGYYMFGESVNGPAILK